MRVLIVPSGQKRDVARWCRRALASCSDVVVLEYDFSQKGLFPSGQRGLAYSAEALVVGIKPLTVSELTNNFQLRLAEEDVLRGDVKQNQAKILAWLGRSAIVIPDPTFKQIAEHEAAQFELLRFAPSALAKANEVSVAQQDGASRFPEFLREAISALGKLSTSHGIGDGQLDDFFAREAPLAAYASSGQEAVSYLHDGRTRRTKKHLKPKTEQRGYRAPAIKPRLFFDVVNTTPKRGPSVGAQARLFVVVLYFGPHPRSGAVFEVGELSLRTLP